MKPVLWIDEDNLKAALSQGEGGALRYVMPAPEREGDIALYLEPTKAEYDAEGNPLNLMAAARDACSLIESDIDPQHRYARNLRKFIGDAID